MYLTDCGYPLLGFPKALDLKYFIFKKYALNCVAQKEFKMQYFEKIFNYNVFFGYHQENMSWAEKDHKTVELKVSPFTNLTSAEYMK